MKLQYEFAEAKQTTLHTAHGNYEGETILNVSKNQGLKESKQNIHDYYFFFFPNLRERDKAPTRGRAEKPTPH